MADYSDYLKKISPEEYNKKLSKLKAEENALPNSKSFRHLPSRYDPNKLIDPQDLTQKIPKQVKLGALSAISRGLTPTIRTILAPEVALLGAAIAPIEIDKSSEQPNPINYGSGFTFNNLEDDEKENEYRNLRKLMNEK